MEQQEEMGEKASNYIRNLHIIGRSRYAHPATKRRDPELATHDQEASFGILEVIARPGGGGVVDTTHMNQALSLLHTPTVTHSTPLHPSLIKTSTQLREPVFGLQATMLIVLSL